MPRPCLLVVQVPIHFQTMKLASNIFFILIQEKNRVDNRNKNFRERHHEQKRTITNQKFDQNLGFRELKSW